MTEDEVTDAQLLAYLDGEADDDTAVLITQSPTLQKRAAELARLQTFLAAALPANPPDTLALAEYALSLLPADQAAALTAYLAAHPHAAAQLASLKQTWQSWERPSPAAQPSPLQTLKLWVAERLTTPAFGRPAFAVRGEAEMVYQAGDVQIILDVDDDSLQPGRKTLTGQLLNLPPGDWHVRLWLTANGDLEWETAVSPHAAFLFDGLPPGPYTLLIHNPTTEIYVETMTTGD